MLHVSLHGLWVASGDAAIFEEGARAALPLVIAPCFDVTFNRAASFGKSDRYGQTTYPLVLRPDLADRPRLHDLWDGIGHALERTLGGRAGKLEPHITVAYPSRPIVEHLIPPITWRVTEIVLIRSLRGQTRHIVVDRRRLYEPA